MVLGTSANFYLITSSLVNPGNIRGRTPAKVQQIGKKSLFSFWAPHMQNFMHSSKITILFGFGVSGRHGKHLKLAILGQNSAKFCELCTFCKTVLPECHGL